MTVHASGWSETEVTIRYPRIRGIITLVEVIPIFLLLFLFAVFPLLYLPRMWSEMGAYLFCGVLAVGAAWYLWFIVRNIESVFTTFRVSQTQLIIENSRYGVLMLNWGELTRATYTRIGIAGETITLEAPQLAKPVAIMSHLRTAGSTGRFVIAHRLIQRAMGDRWIERWF